MSGIGSRRSDPVVRIGTRGSQLALWQANEAARRLGECGLATEIVVIRTSGDRLGEAVLAEAGGKRLFVKEIEDALADGRVDVAVHSTKDMPVEMPHGPRDWRVPAACGIHGMRWCCPRSPELKPRG